MKAVVGRTKEADPSTVDAPALEGLAIEIYRRFKLDPARPVSTVKLARKLYGESCIVRSSLVGDRRAATGWLGGKVFIGYRRQLPTDEIRHAVGHEIIHIETGLKHTGDPVLETWMDYGSACLMCPRPALLALYRAHGWDLAAIAKVVSATETWAALRLGEVLDAPLAAVSPALVRVRGPAEHVWPDERTIRGWASMRHLGLGLRKVAISDRPRRMVLVADG